jgi:hypothetical protein
MSQQLFSSNHRQLGIALQMILAGTTFGRHIEEVLSTSSKSAHSFDF